MDRRTFLRGATVVGSGVIAGGAVAGCSSPSRRSSSTNASTPSSTEPGKGPPDWAKLSGSLTGTLFQPSDSGYAAAGHLYNSVYTLTAAAIAQCESTSDVQRCLAFGREHGVEVTAHSGDIATAATRRVPDWSSTCRA